jgi:trans-2,3-dihydro-3-hydroxyanthranilate isomerase
VEEVSTGLPFIIIPLVSLEAVRQGSVDLPAYHALIEKAEAKSLLIFAPETYREENQLNCRMFDHYHGIPEDPATGSANGCLAAYLVRHRYFGSSEIRVRVEQGYEIKRPSLLLLEAKEERGVINVWVGGSCILTARGELL